MNIIYGLIIVIMLLIGTNINAYAVPQILKVSDKRTVEGGTWGDALIYLSIGKFK